MKKNTLVLAILAAMGTHGIAYAEPSVEIGGVVEIEASSGEDSSDIAVATAELGIAAQINEQVSAELVLLHEAGEDDPVVVDVATVTLDFSEQVSATAGLTTAPFGVFDTNMISDPLTLEMGETGATLLQADFVTGPLTTSVYTFNGANASNDKIDNWGINIGYQAEQFGITLGYIANLGDSDGIAAETIDEKVAGLSISAGASFGDFTLIAEHVRANKAFNIGDGNDDYALSSKAKPSASNLELGYTMDATTFAVGMQRTREAEEFGLAEKRRIAAITHEWMANTTISLEHARDEDYAGEETAVTTLKLAVEF